MANERLMALRSKWHMRWLGRRFMARQLRDLAMSQTDIATSMNSLACVLQTNGRYDQAELSYREALAILKAAGPRGSGGWVSEIPGAWVS